MAASLLAHLYSHIKGSQEDVATLSLQYIVSRFSRLNYEFTKLLGRALRSTLDTDLNFVCQSVGENLERPDISGVNSDGIEQIICEAKFYAGLTDNQPNGYIDRLKQEDAVGLVFICPAARKTALWIQLLELCKDRTVERIDDYCAAVDSIRMAIVTWGDIIESLRHVAASDTSEALSDIDQLDGFCKLMDTEAFIPFSPEDFGPEIARKEDRFYRVIDELIEFLKADKSLEPSTKGVKATAFRQGYFKAINIKGYWVTVSYDRGLWLNPSSTETPFWVSIRGANWKQDGYIARAIKRIPASEQDKRWGWTYFALHPMMYGQLDDIVASIKNQILAYIDICEEERNKQ